MPNHIISKHHFDGLIVKYKIKKLTPQLSLPPNGYPAQNVVAGKKSLPYQSLLTHKVSDIIDTSTWLSTLTLAVPVNNIYG